MSKALLKKPSNRSSTQDSASPALRPTMLLVLGMHRSGTSVTARLLECLGAVNSDGLMPATAENPQGYFEDNDIYLFNEFKFLPRLGRAWHSIAMVDWSNLSDSDRSKYALQALEIVKKNYSLSNSLSVLKEPRLGILVPFWLAVLRHAGFNTKIVCALRDPVSVIRSLNKAQGLSLPHAGMLYVNYWLSILIYCRDLEVSFVQYDEIFVNPAKSLRDVASKLSLPLPQDFEERVHHFSSSFFDKNLRHSTLETKDLGLETDLPPLALELYKSLLAAAQAQNIKKTAKFLEMAKETTESLHPTFLEFDRQFSQIHSSNSRIHELQTELDAERAAGNSVHLAAAVSERDGRIAGLEGAVAQAQGEAAERTEWAQKLNEELEKSRVAVAQAQGEAAERTEWAQKLNEELEKSRVAVAQAQGEAAERTQWAQKLNEELEKSREAVSELQSERDSLASERSTLDARLSTLSSEHSLLATERDAISTRVLTLESDLQERFEELAKLAKLQISTEDERSTLDSRLSTLSSEHSTLVTNHSALVAERDSLASERSTLDARLSTLSSEHASLVTSHSSLIADRDELATERDDLASAIKEIHQSTCWKLTSPIRAVGGFHKKIISAIHRFLVSLRILFTHQNSGLFDPVWYLEKNPDVKAASARPFIHFCFHGVFEGRAPSAAFSAEKYLAQNLDVARSGMCAEVHYLLHGWREGR